MSRQQLSQWLHEICPNVYFQLPTSTQLRYPYIRYEKDEPLTQHADNGTYIYYECYSILVVDANPDSEIPKKVAHLPMCKPGKKYISNNFYHYPFSIYC